MRFLALFALAFVLFSCSTPEIKTGSWRGVLEIQGQKLPFNFRIVNDFSKGYDAYLKNAGEELLLDEVTMTGDSVNMVLHVFDAQLRAAVEGNTLNGFFTLNYNPGYKVPFTATLGEAYRFKPTDTTANATNFSGKYQVVFVNETDTTQAIGVFNQTGNYATGSFLTSTGDYRYLEGGVFNDTLFLSTFDGNHAYLFKAVRNDSTLTGDFWSGRSYHQSWTGVKNENASLPDAESLTYLKPGYETLDFKFPDLNGKPVTLKDDRFKNKVVVLQLFGTWCPNCMDETKYLSLWYDNNKDRGVEILGLAFERKPDFTYATERVTKMKTKWGVNYDFVIVGVDDKLKAAGALPALNTIVAFPTTIFIGKDGKVKHIHTGFEGPGTGVYHERWKQRFNEIINELLSEELAAKK
ncbi:MAG: TlpA family protein disulfide reductase [Cyclobacteriaceae bacterium]|nr:TlpA family protein disulfide reductase [Cyclobacteriaceae bacterium]